MLEKCETVARKRASYNFGARLKFIMATPSLAISLLGPLRVVRDGAPVSDFKYNKARALLAYLAVEAGTPRSRAEVCALLWPNLAEKPARRNLTQVLTALRDAFGEDPAAPAWLLTSTDSVQLNSTVGLHVDVAGFGALLDASETHPHHSWHTCHTCAERLREALALYRGDFLSQVYVADSAPFEEWALLWRERLRQRAMSALERLAHRAEWCGRYAQGVEHARRLVELDPLREAGHRELMRLLALDGQSAAAQAQYEHLRRVLADELGVEPEAETVTLHASVRAGQRDALRRYAAPPVNGPVPPNALIGRAAELETVAAQLRANDIRALTLIGAPGLGKTRLALEAAHALRFDFEDGVHVVELAPVAEAGHVASTLASVLGIKEQAGKPLPVTIIAHLKSRHALLVLDNFEHVLEAAGFIADLLAACPAVKVLVTSRAPLLIRAEQQHALAPLAESDSIQLFEERVRALQPAFTLNDANRAVVAALCARVDYLPLAIELIAVRARSLSPAELLQQLEHRLSALESGPRDIPERQRTLRSAIAWSYELVRPEEQHVFAHLGAFAGSGTLQAIRAVAGDGVDVLAALEALTQASLIFTQPVAGETRFALLETIREFALEQLARRDAQHVAQQRHADWYAGMAMDAYFKLISPEAAAWSERIAAELDNIRTAFQWALAHNAVEPAVQLATGVWRFYWMRGLLREGLARLEAVLKRRAAIPPRMLSPAMRAAGTLALGLSEYTRARGWLEAALEAGRQNDDRRAVQSALTNLGFTLIEQGELEPARRYLEDSLALTHEDGDRYRSKFPLSILGGLYLRAGDFPKAQAHYEESLHLNREYQDVEGMADTLRGLAKAVNAQGDPARARQLAEEGLALHATLNHQLGLGFGHAVLGDIARERGDYAEALEQYRQCLRRWLNRENVVNCTLVFDDMAGVLAALNRHTLALHLMGAAEALCEKAGVKLTPHEQARREATLAACRGACAPSIVAAAWEAGRALTLEQAMALALASSS
jgi:predicted ATPase/DNA-binding SARP family transcriptional activator